MTTAVLESKRPELKPCPFCGSSALMRREPCPDGGGYFAFIECKSCRARSGDTYYSSGNDCPQTYQGRREAWNTRTTAPRPLPPQPKPACDWDPTEYGYAERMKEQGK